MNRPPIAKKKALVAAASILILPILLLTSLAFGQASSSNTLQVSYIDVGQGDSIWLHASDGTDILIDGGPRAAGPTVVAYLFFVSIFARYGATGFRPRWATHLGGAREIPGEKTIDGTCSGR